MPNFTVKEKETGQRLDVYLASKLTDYSRAFIQKMIRDSVTVNSKSSRASYKLRTRDKVFVKLADRSEKKLSKLNIKIIYEDNDCIVINKPIGVLSHAKGRYVEEATVETFIADKVSGFEGDRAGIVHRLDRATSGVMICAKHPEAHKWLQKQFSTRRAVKQYSAVVSGHMAEDKAIIDMPIERNPKHPATFRVGSNGKSATTEYKVIRASSHYSLLNLVPKTGRTHQIRVHLSYIGHPVVGDSLYNGKPVKRLFLHSHSLEIKLLDQSIKKFEAKLPSDFNKIILSDHD